MDSVSHTAALLAGGKSSRMGRDKAALEVGGVPLWQRQLAVLRATEPAELLISGPASGVYAGAEVEIIADLEPGQGPLGGLAALLAAMRQPWLLVLAVDLPHMPAEYLQGLVATAKRTGRGVVPVRADGLLEPLAAVYPKAASILAAHHLAAGRRKLADWVEGLETDGLVCRREITAGEQTWFVNWNEPQDVG